MIEIKTEEKGFTIKHKDGIRPCPYNSVIWKIKGDNIYFYDTPTESIITSGKISEVILNREPIPNANEEDICDKLISVLFFVDRCCIPAQPDQPEAPEETTDNY